MSWTTKARERSLDVRRARRAHLDEGTWLTVLMQVASVGGGLSRALRILAIHGVSQRSGSRGRAKALTRMDVYRAAKRIGLAAAMCRGSFLPGRLQVEKRCHHCGADLAASPWCPCIPAPVWTCDQCGEQRELGGDMRPCLCERRKKNTEPKRRLAKWYAARRAVTTRRKTT